MNILFVTKGGYRPSGGAQRAGRAWYEHLHTKVNCTLLTGQRDTNTTRGNPLSHLAPLDYFQSMRNLSRELLNVSREMFPDIIHIHSYTGYVAIPPKGIPTVVTLQDEPELRLLDWVSPPPARLYSSLAARMERFFKKWMFSAGPWYHAVSSTIKMQLLGLGAKAEKIRVIPNGFPDPPSNGQHMAREELLEQLGLFRDSRLVLTIGNLGFRKAAHKVLFASKLTQVQKPDIQYLIVGSNDSPLERAYVSKLRSWQRQHQIHNFHLLGYVEPRILDALLHHADVYLSPSLSEACNLALMEAAVFGLPIIATDAGATRDLFDGEATILPRTATPRDIAKAVLDNINCGKKDYSHAKRDSWEEVSRRLVAFYEYILEKGI